MKKIKTTRHTKWLLLFAFLVCVAIPLVSSRAATLSQARDYLSRNQANLASGVIHEFIFTPATNVSGGGTANEIIVLLPDADDGNWCRSEGNLTAGTGTLKESAVGIPGTPTAACTQGSGGTSYDTITISGVGNLTAGTTYGVRVSDGAGALGTDDTTGQHIVTVKTNNGSTDVDTRSIALVLITSDQITISGTVDPTLTFSVDDTAIGFGAIATGNVRYATDDESAAGGANAPDSAGNPVQLAVTTNADDGAVIEIKDTNAVAATGLYSADSGTTLLSTASSSIAAGTAAFGLYGKSATGLTIDEGFDNDTNADVAISNSFQTFASSSAPIDTGTVVDVQPIAAISAVTPAGAYADTLTVVATGKF